MLGGAEAGLLLAEETECRLTEADREDLLADRESLLVDAGLVCGVGLVVGVGLD